MILSFNEVKGGAAAPVMGGAGTTVVTNLTLTGADLSGTWTGSGITANGFVVYPTGNASTIIGGVGVTNVVDPSFATSPTTATVTGLTGGATYCTKPYATNAGGTSYGEEACFTVPLAPRVSIAAMPAYTGPLGALYRALYRSGKFYIALDNQAVYEYDIATDAYTLKTTIPGAKQTASAWEIVGDKIYLIGGTTTSFDNIATNRIYDIVTDTRTTGTSKPTANYQINSFVEGTKIHCIGYTVWTGAYTYANNHEVYDTVTDTWTTETNPTGWREQSYMSNAILGNKIYQMGGTTTPPAITLTNEIKSYDVVSDTWAVEAQTVPSATRNSSLIVLGSVMYQIGGRVTSNAVTNYVGLFTPGTGWTTKTVIPTASAYNNVGTDGTNIYAFGMYNGSAFVGTSYKYIPSAD